MDFNNHSGETWLLDRSVVVLRPKEPYERWVQQIHSPEVLSLDEVRENTDAYLIPYFESRTESFVWIRDNFATIFERQLVGWHIDEDVWPSVRTWEVFTAWFDVDLIDLTWDLIDARLLREWETRDDNLPADLLGRTVSVEGQRDLEGIYRSPNGSAEEKTEIRIGPPLDYVGGKVRTAIVGSYDAVRASLNTSGSKELDLELIDAVMRGEAKNEACWHAMIAFQFSLHAYLALQNMLALMYQKNIVERLLCMKREDLRLWLDRITQEGSVTG